MKAKVTVNAIRVDLENAYNRLVVLLDMTGMPTDAVALARERTASFLAQCEADQARLEAYKAALADCVAGMDWDHGEAYTNARALLGLPNN